MGCSPEAIADTRGMFTATTDYSSDNVVSMSIVRGVLPAGARRAYALTESGHAIPVVANAVNAYEVRSADLITSYEFTDEEGATRRMVVGGRIHSTGAP